METNTTGPGKGDRQRPIGNRKQFEKNYERIFGKKKLNIREDKNDKNSDNVSEEPGSDRAGD